jgi:hypothetical protein
MMDDEDVFKQEMGSPSYETYKEDLVGEYIWLDSKTQKLYRYMQDDSFQDLDENDQRELMDKYMLMTQLKDLVWYRAGEKDLRKEINLLLQ